MQYATDSGPDWKAAAEPTATIDPLRSSRCGSAARHSRNAPVRLVRSTLSHPSGVCVSTEPEREMPAFGTARSRPPRPATVSATTRSASAGSPVSPTATSVRPPAASMLAATSRSGSSRRPLSATA